MLDPDQKLSITSCKVCGLDSFLALHQNRVHTSEYREWEVRHRLHKVDASEQGSLLIKGTLIYQQHCPGLVNIHYGRL